MADRTLSSVIIYYIQNTTVPTVISKTHTHTQPKYFLHFNLKRHKTIYEKCVLGALNGCIKSVFEFDQKTLKFYKRFLFQIA